MSDSHDTYEHPVAHHDPKEGFDRSEPNTTAIWWFTAGSFLALIAIIAAVTGYFDSIYQAAVYDKILAPPSEQLRDLRNRDAWNMTHYMYGDLDKSSGRVRVPVDQAMELFAKEASAGKLFYPAKATAIKVETPDSAAGPAGTPGAPAAPATGAAPEKGAPEKAAPAKK